MRVLAAIEEAWSEDGVLLLLDMGSAVLAAEMAVELLPPERQDRCLLSSAPRRRGHRRRPASEFGAVVGAGERGGRGRVECEKIVIGDW
ncbi:MAG: hypothetical protein R2856_01405 [Caldilineaceae bacterium]